MPPPPLPSLSHHLRSLLPSLTLRHLSSSAAAAWDPRNRPANVFEADPGADYSERYRHKIKYTRPSTLNKWILRPHLINSASFIGTVEWQPRVVGTRDGSFGVYTAIRVSTGAGSGFRRPLRILAKFWDELAETAFDHLKDDDFIYVSGPLRSYEKDSQDGRNKIHYVVNHGWRRNGTASTCGKFSLSTHLSGMTTGEVRRILSIPTSEINTPTKFSGYAILTLHGLKNNSSCMIQGWLRDHRMIRITPIKLDSYGVRLMSFSSQ